MSVLQLGAQIGKRHALLFHEDEQVVDEIGDLMRELRLVVILGCDDRLNRFFAHLLCDLVHAAAEQICSIRPLNGILLSVLNDARKLAKEGESRSVALDDAVKEATSVSRMAGSALLLHLHQKAVPVAVEGGGNNFLRMTARLTLLPKTIARTAVIVCVARLERLVKRLGIHICLHQHFARLIVLRNCADEPVCIKFYVFHIKLLRNQSPSVRMGSPRSAR